MAHKVGILAIGTELTSGEVLNTNATWLAERLTSMGFSHQQHLSVSDESEDIQAGIHYLSERSSLLFVTGGLGPTSDDLTREELAKWLNSPLQLREDTWRALQSLCQQREMAIREGHKRQCYFPKGVELLNNPVGTAKGFWADLPGLKVFALPGPPREIKAMWQEALQPILNELVQDNTLVLYRWSCLNVAESEVAEVVEKVLEGENLKIGYRANIPYVQVKVWGPPRAEQSSWYKKLNSALEHWAIQSERDPAEELLGHLFQLKRVVIFDGLSKGRLTARFEEVKERTEKLGPAEFKIVAQLYGEQFEPLLKDDWTQLRLLPGDTEKSYVVEALISGSHWSKTFELPYRLNHFSKRGSFYITEQAIYAWLQFVRSIKS